jgi:GTP-binding protein EngB required for normal cell division
METLPETLPEACFAGRSNVGKSSLVNMVTNRKKLAFRSKTPGKTQQFNYFVVNKDEGIGSKFYLVDLPGVGYAEVLLSAPPLRLSPEKEDSWVCRCFPPGIRIFEALLELII